MKAATLPRAITLGRTQLGAVLLCLAILLVAVYTALEPYVETAIWERVLAPAFEKRFGFTGARRTITVEGRQHEEYYLAEVHMGGPLFNAGFRPGDVPSGAMHEQSVAFLNLLDNGCIAPGTASIRREGGPEDERIDLQVPCAK